MRKTEFVNGEYYHVFNRGVDKRDIFSSQKDYERMLETIWFVNDKETHFGLSDHKRTASSARPLGSVATDPKGQEAAQERLVEIICYCLNPNHYHFILKQLKDGGVAAFMGKLGNSYTKYFNAKHERSGSLFQGPYKSIHIDSNEYLLYLSAYVNGNNFIHGYNDSIEDWSYCSYLDYVGKRIGKLCQKEMILNQFKDQNEYESFCQKNMLYLKDKKESECYLLE